MDIYRPLSLDDDDDFRPFRGNVFTALEFDEEGYLMEKDSLGHIPRRTVSEEENIGRRNYQRADNINHLDGDYSSHIDASHWSPSYEDGEEAPESDYMYEYGQKSLINDNVRVFKGGSWNDRAYFMNPGTRRFLEENLETSYLGFRCAMDRVGSPVGLGGRR